MSDDPNHLSAPPPSVMAGEQMYRSLFENMLNGFACCRMLYDDEGRPNDFVYLTVNAAFEKQTGLKNVVGRKVTEVIPGIREMDPELFDIYGRVASTGRPETFERYVQALQMWFHVSVYSHEKGHFVAVFDVITERKRVEESLRESEERYRALFESSSDAILTADPPSWKFTSCNTSAVKMFRTENADGFVALGPWELSPEKQPDGRPSTEKAMDMIETAMRVGTHFFEWTHRRCGGGDFPATVLLSRVEMGEKVFLQATVRDITDRKRLDERMVQIHAVLLTHESDPEKKINSLVAVAGKMFGATAVVYNRLESGQLRMVGSWNLPSTVPRIDCCEGHICTDVITSRRENYVSIRNLHRTPYAQTDAAVEKFGLKTYFSHVVYVGQKRIGCLAVVFDRDVEPAYGDGEVLGIIAAGIGAEEMRMNYIRQDLELKERMFVSEKMAALGTLVAGVAHEINNPLTSVLGYVDLIRRSTSLEQCKQDVETLGQEARRCAKVAQDLLVFSRASKTPEKSECNLNHVVEDMMELYKYQFRQAAIRVETKLDPGLPHILANAHRMQIVVVNLFVNAIHALEHRAGNRVLSVSTTRGEDRVVLTLRDNGNGIPREHLTRIFEPFFTTKEVGKGTGLGLSICYGIVEEHGGNIRAESEEAGGTTFVIEIPILIKRRETDGN